MDAFEAVSSPEPSLLDGKKFFSVPQANRTLTLVRRIAEDIVQEYGDLRDLHDRCRTLDQCGPSGEAEDARQKYASVTDHLSELKEELEKIGCDLKGYHLGLVDFPALMNGREVCICWKLGEDDVKYWHEIDAGFSGRQAIQNTLFE